MSTQLGIAHKPWPALADSLIFLVLLIAFWQGLYLVVGEVAISPPLETTRVAAFYPSVPRAGLHARARHHPRHRLGRRPAVGGGLPAGRS